MAEEAKAPDGATPEEGGKKKLPLWVIILIASQVVVVVAAIVVFKMMSGASHSSEEKHEEPSAAEQKVDPEKLKDPKTLTGPQFNLDAFIINLIDDGRGPRYLKVEMKFELENEAVREELDSRISQIRDEMLTLLSSKRQTDIETTDGKRILKDEIYTRINKILVTGRIKRVFFTEFVVQ